MQGQAAIDAVLVMERIRKQFPGVKALDGVSISCERGEVRALVGENGAGKSTLMKILAGVYQADEGRVIYNGREVQLRAPQEARDLGISIIHQERSLLPKLSVAKNIFLGKEIRSKIGLVNYKLMNQEAEKLLEEVGLHLDPTLPVYRLDLAEQQLVEIAKALALNAEVIVMDEPSAALSSGQLNYLFNIIETLKKKMKTVIYISHRLDEIFQVADSVTVLKDGKLVGTQRVGEVDKNLLIEMMTGRSMEQVASREYSTAARDILVIKGLGSGSAFKNINFSVREQEILSIYGLLGAGRTEVVKALFGVYPIDTGEIYFRGEKLHKINPRMMIQLGVSYISKNRKEEGLLLGLPIRDNISLPSLGRLFSRIGLINETSEESAVRESVNRLHIQCLHIMQLARVLSGGNQQKVVLAKWLMVDSKVIVADEPTWGIDVGSKVEMYRILRGLASSGKGILVISSDLPEILKLSDRILVMKKGEIVREFSTATATEKEILKLAI